MRNKISKIVSNVRLLTERSREPYSLYEKLIGSRINDPTIYETALTHKSANIKNDDGSKRSNERLEYLGDAVIEMVISEMLYNMLPEKDEGFLTAARSNIVRRNTLNVVGKEMGLDDRIIVDNNVTNKSHDVLGNAVEALAGAVLVDLGYDAAKMFVEKKIVGRLPMKKLLKRDADCKSKMIEICRSKNIQLRFDTEAYKDEEGKEDGFYTRIYLNEKRMSEARGMSKKEAEQNASEYMINWMKKHQNYVF